MPWLAASSGDRTEATVNNATSPVIAQGAGPATAASAASGEALKHLQLDVERLMDAYELDVICHSCNTLHKCAIGWLRVHSTMECENCRSSIVLRTSLMNEEMRRVARQLRKLREQLSEMIGRAGGRLRQ
jgi:hypothetical protein